MDKTAEVKAFMQEYISRNGFAPTFREMGKGVGVKSTSTIHHLINNMLDDGVVTMVRGKSRTLRLVDDDENVGGMSGGTGA